MKRAKSKFALTRRPVPQYGEGGGFFKKIGKFLGIGGEKALADPLSKALPSPEGAPPEVIKPPKTKFSDSSFGKMLSSPEGSAAAKTSITAASSLLNKQEPIESGLNDEQYQKDMDNANSTGGAIGSVAGIASMIPGPVGLIASGIGALAEPIGDLFGGAAAKERAKEDARKRKFQRDLDATNIAGAQNKNSLGTYQAPAYGQYGRRGIKLKSRPGMPGGLKMRFNTKFGKQC